MKYISLILITPLGLLISINSYIKGWENGKIWWTEWRDIFMNRPKKPWNFE